MVYAHSIDGRKMDLNLIWHHSGVEESFAVATNQMAVSSYTPSAMLEIIAGEC